MRVLFFSTYEIVKQSGGVESVTRFLYEYLFCVYNVLAKP